MLSSATIHELRGAANVLALHLQLLAIEPTDEEAIARRKRSLAAADDGRRRLFDIAETFVRLALVPDAAERDFDLAQVTTDAVTLARPYAVQRRVALTMTPATGPATTRGRRDVVSQTALDLLLALLERSSNGEALEVTVATSGGSVQAALRSAAVGALDPPVVDQAASAMRWAGGALRVGDDGVYLQLSGASPGESV